MIRAMKKVHSEMGRMNGMAVVLQRFGDEESTLFDQYERLSFEIQLNQAIIGRSLSEPRALSRTPRALTVAPPPQPQVNQQGQAPRPRKLGFQKILKKLLKPIIGGGRAAAAAARRSKDIRVEKDHKLWKTFSRSLRF